MVRNVVKIIIERIETIEIKKRKSGDKGNILNLFTKYIKNRNKKKFK